MRDTLFLSLILAFAPVSVAQLSGPLSGVLGPGTYHVVGNISVESGDSLRLLPGTTFTFDGPYPFWIYGPLSAEGTESDSIVFTADTLANPDRWRGLRFRYPSSSDSRLAYCLIENSHAAGSWPDNLGGGFYCYDASPTLVHCTVADNAAESGGGVCCWSAAPHFMNCIIRNNSAVNDGGGIDCSSASPTFINCIIRDNRATYRGGGVDCFSASPTFVNCIIFSNAAQYGGGVRGVSSSGTFEHCTVGGNASVFPGEGFDCRTASFTVRNSIVTTSDIEAIYFENSAASRFEHCCIFRSNGEPIAFDTHPSDGPPGLAQLVRTNANGDSCDTYGNIFRGPRFVDAEAGNFHLSDYSACIGVGEPGGPDEDIAGNPRPNPPGSDPDMGAYENVLAAPLHYEELSGALSGTLGPGTFSVIAPISLRAYLKNICLLT